MIISHDHQFIFIKTHKTAGTSIEIALSSICGENDIITPISPKDENQKISLGYKSAQNYRIVFSQYTLSDWIRFLFKNKRKEFHRHMAAKEIKKRVSRKIWKNYFKFTIERNPYDRVVSLYYWRNRNQKYTSLHHFLTSGGFVRFRTLEMYTKNNKILVDKIYKFEELNEMMADITKKLNLEMPLMLSSYQAKSNTRKIANYKEVIDEKSKAWIDKKFKKEIELFNYRY